MHEAVEPFLKTTCVSPMCVWGGVGRAITLERGEGERNCPGGNHPGGQMTYRGFNWWRIGGGQLSGGNCPQRGIDLDLKQL